MCRGPSGALSAAPWGARQQHGSLGSPWGSAAHALSCDAHARLNAQYTVHELQARPAHVYNKATVSTAHHGRHKASTLRLRRRHVLPDFNRDRQPFRGISAGGIDCILLLTSVWQVQRCWPTISGSGWPVLRQQGTKI